MFKGGGFIPEFSIRLTQNYDMKPAEARYLVKEYKKRGELQIAQETSLTHGVIAWAMANGYSMGSDKVQNK